MSPAALGLGYTLELLLGDPEGWPHPVRGVGWAIARGETVLRSRVRPLWLAGVTLSVLVVGASAAATLLARDAVDAAAPGAVVLFDGAVLYLVLSANQLLREGWNVRRLLGAGDLAGARTNLARFVSRRTDELDETEIVKGTIESLGENFSDGVVAPLFYFCLGGPAAAVAYKVVNTLDSMVGYKNERYLEFGRFAARLDDLANWIPARLAATVLVCAAPLAGLSPSASLRTLLRDGAKHESPNAGLGKAAVAGALGVRLGGPARYSDGVRERPWIGANLRPLSSERIGEAVRHLLAACALCAVGSALLAFAS